MNPLTNVKNIEKLSKLELDRGIPIEKSWHQQYKDSAWIFFGGLNYDLTEGDVICVFSQYGEVANINLIRDHKTGKSKGFGFLCYEDQRSTILAVDNLNGIKLASRIIRVDHVEEYKVPKIKEDTESERKKLFTEGCAPQPIYHHNQTKDEEVETLAVIPNG
ncbi:RNA-binding motif protein, X-linked 2, partial [Armadillidium nasatum]